MTTSPISHLKAIGFSLLGFTIWVLSDVCMKLAGEASVPLCEVLAFVGLSGIVMTGLRARHQGSFKKLWPKKIKPQLLRAGLTLTSYVLNVIALKHLSLSLFFVTVFTTPMMTAMLAIFFLREHLTPLKALAIIAGFAGVIIAADPFQSQASSDWIGYVAALGSALTFAISMIVLRVLTQSESTDSLTFFSSLVILAVCVIGMLFHAEPLSFKLVVILTAMGALGIIGNIYNYIALRHTTAANVSQVHYTQIITGAAFGYLIWHDVPTLSLVIGTVIIIASGLYMAADAHRMPGDPSSPL